MEASAKGSPFFSRMKNDLTAGNLCEALHNVRYAPLPSEKVAVGERWKRTHKVATPLFGQIETHYDCTLEKLDIAGERPVAVIAYSSVTRNADGAEAPKNELGVQPKLIEWTAEGRIEVDARAGEPLRQRQTSRVRYELALPPSGDRAAATINVDGENTYVARVRGSEPQTAPSPASHPSSAPSDSKPRP
jgi:hypothetical protein